MDAKWAEFMEQYPDQWVLVYREKLLATAPTLEEAFGHIEKKGLRPDLVTKRYTETREMVWVRMPFYNLVTLDPV